MLITLPHRVPMPTALALGGLLFVAQIVEGTTPMLAASCFMFVLLSVIAFNIAGGMVYASGSYVAACAVLTVGLGMIVKAVLGQPMQRNLLVPEKSMLVYVVGMCSMAAACYVNRLMRPRSALLDRFPVQGNASRIGIACLVVAFGVPFLLPEAARNTFEQGNHFVYLAILIPVFDTVRRSGGRKSFNMVALLAWGWSTFFGLVTFSKEGIFGASAAWAVGAVAAGYRTSFRKLATVGVLAAIAAMILMPYSQIGRGVGRNLDTSVAVSVAVNLLSHPIDLRESYQATALDINTNEGTYHLFDEPEGLLDRLNMFSVDDALINITDKGITAPPSNLWSYFTNLIPRYLWPDKPNLSYGNVYAHPLNMLPVDDDTTGISFSPFADGYHCAQWVGVSLYSFGIFLFGFFLMDAVGGSTDNSVWAMLFILYDLHQAPEALLNGPVYGGGTYSLFVIGAAVICTKLVPIIMNLVSTPDQAPMKHFDAEGRQVQSA